MKPDQDHAAASTDPTVANELRELDALTAANPSPEGTASSAADQEHAARRALRVTHYTEKVRPFVEAWGGRLAQPLTKTEVNLLSDAMADVGAEVIPEGDDEPVSPWKKLLAVSLGIALPRIFARMFARPQSAPDDQGAPPAPASAPATAPKPAAGTSALDLAKGWER